MTWVRIDDGFGDHPKILAVGPIGAIIHMRAFCYCSRHLTDGFIPMGAVEGLLHGIEHIGIADGGCPGLFEFGHDANEVDWPETLVKNKLWERSKNSDGYFVHDYLDYNPSKREILELRKKKKIAGQAGGQASAQARGRATVEHTVEESLNSPPHPLNTNTSESDGNVIGNGKEQIRNLIKTVADKREMK
jgi:hypothetical protein